MKGDKWLDYSVKNEVSKHPSAPSYYKLKICIIKVVKKVTGRQEKPGILTDKLQPALQIIFIKMLYWYWTDNNHIK